jgi:hypothetical protein
LLIVVASANPKSPATQCSWFSLAIKHEAQKTVFKAQSAIYVKRFTRKWSTRHCVGDMINFITETDGWLEKQGDEKTGYSWGWYGRLYCGGGPRQAT